MSLLASVSFEYLCYGSMAIINVKILSVLGLSLYLRIWHLKTVPALKRLKPWFWNPANQKPIVAAGFLELINNMLTSGMVPALYADDEKEAIIGQVSLDIVDTVKSANHIYISPLNFYIWTSNKIWNQNL